MLTIDEVKQYLHLDSDAEDDYLRILVLLACEMCENYTRLELPKPLPESYKQAMLVCIGYFLNRETVQRAVFQVYFIRSCSHTERRRFRWIFRSCAIG